MNMLPAFNTLATMKKSVPALILSFLLCLVAVSCGKTKQSAELEAEAVYLNSSLGAIASESPMFLESVSAAYADGDMNVYITFADTSVNVDTYSDALVQFVLARYMHANHGNHLDTLLNELSKVEGTLTLTLSDTRYNKRSYTITSSRLKQIFRARTSELNFNDVKENIRQIMAARCDTYNTSANAQSTSFAYANGFAQYTLTFENRSKYSNLTQGSLTGRYLNVLKPQYENYGACRSLIQDVLTSLQIEGYRFVYTAGNENNSLKATIPWRIID